MTTYPSKPDNIRKPYTDSEQEYNMKPREVYCKICKYTTWTNLPGPRCGGCKSYLISVPRYPELMK